MDPSDYFTITLSSGDLSFTDNTLALFRTCLPQQMSLEGKWVVGLSELHYTRSWYNVKKDETISIFNDRGETIASPMLVHAGYYNQHQLVDAINKSLQQCCSKLAQEVRNYYLGPKPPRKPRGDQHPEFEAPTIALDDVSHHVVITPGRSPLDQQRLHVDISGELKEMLGFTNAFEKYDHANGNEITLVPQQETIKGEKYAYQCYDLSNGVNTLYVYCNLVSPQILGNTLSPLLRVLPVDDTPFGAQCHKVYPKPHFYPLACNNFQVVGIEVRESSGDPVGFKFGDTTAVLEFRRVK